MTWAPCRRIVRADVPFAFRVRGINAPLLLCWPDTFLNGSADYSIDFASQLCCGEVLVDAAFSVSGGSLGWSGKPTYTATIATAWVTWTMAGIQQIEVTVLTSEGRSLSTLVQINVKPIAALLSGGSPSSAPNILTLPDGTPLLTESGRSLLTQ
ncbi:hypothetical protein HKD27_09090 [Gluconobacter sp. R75690]|uniref:hypothetical protein n=1 Tax=unclassified Gluconobacter TaxID=2644261 RepID=UPI00188B3E58|nr:MULTISPECIES: hypothetical protein [unclassified Gluconobacter]MBF0851073.1 hypothetical protein [Gluconobacter sp. R75690]MBF0879765.1 hypothetical protein [Gluconobacter sp. R75828]